MKQAVLRFGILGWMALMPGCASKPDAVAQTAPAKKIHYVTIPPQTGSYVSRRIAVDEDGKPVDPADAHAVQQVDPAMLDRIRPPSSSPAGGGH